MADDQYTFTDPTTQYPRPEFQKQSQSKPGLAWPRHWNRPRTTARTAGADRDA